MDKYAANRTSPASLYKSSLPSPKPKIFRMLKSQPRAMATHSARHSSYDEAIEPKTELHVCPGLYQVDTGLLVTGLMGGFLTSKLYSPGAVSWRSLPVPWPKSS